MDSISFYVSTLKYNSKDLTYVVHDLFITESQITRILPCRTITIIKPNFNKQTDIKMVDPERVLSYDDMLKVIHQPQKVIIDVRNPDEVNTTGKIPSSINIPCNIFYSIY